MPGDLAALLAASNLAFPCLPSGASERNEGLSMRDGANGSQRGKCPSEAPRGWTKITRARDSSTLLRAHTWRGGHSVRAVVLGSSMRATRVASDVRCWVEGGL